ncbi:hypothetical protein F4777DRAFT_545988 [Nemania sp. FL0916]|nr:hypothetical protein F4777DRAFT_545988 [Nemania sp. FL0916]
MWCWRRWPVRWGACCADIELVINDADQEKAFSILTLHGMSPSVPDASATTPRLEFKRWRELAPTFWFRDRRRARLCVPIYEFPSTGDPTDDYLLPFLILYPASALNLPPVPSTPPHQPTVSDVLAYTALKKMTGLILSDRSSRLSLDCWVTNFRHLNCSELHVSLLHSESGSLIWGQHMAQLSELVRSRSYHHSPRGLPDYVDPPLSEFAQWVELDLKGKADICHLDKLRTDYLNQRRG